MADTAQPGPMAAHGHEGGTRRDFLSIAATAVAAEAAQGEVVTAANLNSPDQVVIAGHAGAVDLSSFRRDADLEFGRLGDHGGEFDDRRDETSREPGAEPGRKCVDGVLG